MPIRNADQVRKELARQRKDALRNTGLPSGYKSESGQSVERPGDNESPFSKLPPFPDRTTLEYLAADFAGGTVLGTALECAKPRVATLWVDYVPAADANAPQLAIVGFAIRPGREENFGATDLYPFSVLDAALAPLPPPAQSFAQRTIFNSEIITPVLTPAGLFRWPIPFDVSMYRTIVFQAREIQEDPAGSAGIVELGITFST